MGFQKAEIFDIDNNSHLTHVCNFYYAPNVARDFLKAQFLIGSLKLGKATFADVFSFIENDLSFPGNQAEPNDS